MSPASDSTSKRSEWRLYAVLVRGEVVCTLASDERVDSADVASAMGIEARDVTVCSLDKVTVTMPGEVDKVTVAVDLSRD